MEGLRLFRKISMKIYAKNTAYVLGERISTALVSFITVILITNFYSLSSLGVYQYSLNITSILIVAIQLFDERIIKNEFVINKNEKKIATLVFMRILMVAIVLLSTIGLREYLSVRSDFIILTCLALGIVSVNTIFNAYYDALSKSNIRFKVSIICNMLIIIMQYIVSYKGFDVISLIYSMVLGSALSFVINTYLIKKMICIKIFEYDIYWGLKVFRKSISFVMASLVYILYMKMDAIMINYFIDETAVGKYSIATQFMSMGLLLLYPMQVGLYPIIMKSFEAGESRCNYIYKIVSQISTLLGYMIVIFFIMIGDILLYYIYNIKNTDVYILSIIYLINALILYNALPRIIFITFKELGNKILLIQVMSLVLNFILNIIFIERIGIYGAAVSTTISSFVSLILSNYFYKELKWIGGIQIKSLFLNYIGLAINLVKDEKKYY